MRRKLFSLAVLPVSFVLGLCAQIVWLSSPLPRRERPETFQKTVPPGYDLTGYYYPAPDVPLVFDNVQRIDLTTADFRIKDSAVVRTPIAPRGYVIADSDAFKMKSVSVGGGRVSFTTEQRLGLSYRFTGRVLPEGKYPVRGFSQYHTATTVMVEGRMVRMLFGFKLAEGVVRFTRGSAC